MRSFWATTDGIELDLGMGAALRDAVLASQRYIVASLFREVILDKTPE